MSNVHIDLAHDFKRADPALLKGHPLRGALKETLRRDHLLGGNVDPRQERISMIRDTVISLMGAVSALIPLVIAFQSAMGA